MELKLRVWNGEKMFYPNLVYNIDLSWNKIGGWCLWDTSTNPHKLIGGEFDFPKIEIMQFTGLKDTNGKEIYDGDIAEKEYDILDKIGIVKMKVAKSQPVYNPIEWYAWMAGNSSLYQYCEECSVIGNIYENPELLEVK